jgi:hypothetical protein
MKLLSQKIYENTAQPDWLKSIVQVVTSSSIALRLKFKFKVERRSDWIQVKPAGGVLLELEAALRLRPRGQAESGARDFGVPLPLLQVRRRGLRVLTEDKDSTGSLTVTRSEVDDLGVHRDLKPAQPVDLVEPEAAATGIIAFVFDVHCDRSVRVVSSRIRYIVVVITLCATVPTTGSG